MLAPGKTLGGLVKAKAEKMDVPIFEWNLYYQFGQGYPKVKFDTDDFFRGLDIRVSAFLEHVDHCVEEYGASNVYI